MSRLAEAARRAEEASAPIPVAVAPRDAVTLAAERQPPASGSIAPEISVSLFREAHTDYDGKLVTSSEISHRALEQYRHIAAVLHQIQLERNARIIMVTSAIAAEGKTLTATNIALTLSGSYRRRVLLVDADLRRPSIHHVFRLRGVTGLSDGLKAENPAPLPLVRVAPQLAVLPAGRPDADPFGVLASDRMRRVLREAAETFDWVIVDTPPVGVLPDTHLLADMVDLAVLIIRAGKGPYPIVQRAINAIGRERIAGVVLNGMDGMGRENHYYYADYYGPARSGRDPRRIE